MERDGGRGEVERRRGRKMEGERWRVEVERWREGGR